MMGGSISKTLRAQARLWRIAYHSIAAANLSDDDLTNISCHAQERNEFLGISGILYFDRGHFIQVLEGGRVAVSGIYKKILADSRHGRVTKVADGPVGGREFLGWSMRLITSDDIKIGERIAVLDALGAADRRDGADADDTVTMRFQAGLRALGRGAIRTPRIGAPAHGIRHPGSRRKSRRVFGT